MINPTKKENTLCVVFIDLLKKICTSNKATTITVLESFRKWCDGVSESVRGKVSYGARSFAFKKDEGTKE